MVTREGELFKDKIEVSLDGRQVFCLFCGGAVVACLVFVLGVMVGRRVEARAHPDRIAAGAAASDPLAALDALAAEEGPDSGRLAFPSALRSGDADAPLGSIDEALAAVAPPEEESAEEGAGKQAAGEEEAAAKPEPEAKPEPQPQPEPERKPEPEAKPAAAPAPSGRLPAQVAPAEARFTLQISSFQDRAEAEALHAKLGKAGYRPFITQGESDGVIWFRVRVGHFRSYEDALAGKKVFEGDLHIIAYVTRL